jgi:uncharacterized protein (TIGR00369 family)
MGRRNAELMQRWIDGTLRPEDTPGITLPATIAKSIPFRLAEIAPGKGVAVIETDLETQANPMGTVHGGVLCTVADAAIGLAHWASLEEGESFTTVDFRINFFRPVWRDTLTATARVVHGGRTVSYYDCAITRADGKLVAQATSTVMTLRGDAASGR